MESYFKVCVSHLGEEIFRKYGYKLQANQTLFLVWKSGATLSDIYSSHPLQNCEHFVLPSSDIFDATTLPAIKIAICLSYCEHQEYKIFHCSTRDPIAINTNTREM